MSSIIATKPLEVLAMDFTQLEPASDGQENVLVLTDVFMKFTVAIPTRDQRLLMWLRPSPGHFNKFSDEGRSGSKGNLKYKWSWDAVAYS